MASERRKKNKSARTEVVMRRSEYGHKSSKRTWQERLLTTVKQLAAGLLVSAASSVTLGTVTGCAHATPLPEDVRTTWQQKYDGKYLWLTQSLYYGQFYDDDRYQLVHARKFDQVLALTTFEGEPIFPPPEQGILPAGTKVYIEKIEWPTGDVIARRPLYTPRYDTWVYMRVGRAVGEVSFDKTNTHIFLVPGGVDNIGVLNDFFAATFSAEDPNPFLQSLSEDKQEAIAQKRAVRGMNYEALNAALGLPNKIERSEQMRDGRKVTVEVAIFFGDGGEKNVLTDGNQCVLLVDGLTDAYGECKDVMPKAAPPNVAVPVGPALHPAGSDADPDAKGKEAQNPQHPAHVLPTLPAVPKKPK